MLGSGVGPVSRVLSLIARRHLSTLCESLNLSPAAAWAVVHTSVASGGLPAWQQAHATGGATTGSRAGPVVPMSPFRSRRLRSRGCRCRRRCVRSDAGPVASAYLLAGVWARSGARLHVDWLHWLPCPRKWTARPAHRRTNFHGTITSAMRRCFRPPGGAARTRRWPLRQPSQRIQHVSLGSRLSRQNVARSLPGLPSCW